MHVQAVVTRLSFLSRKPGYEAMPNHELRPDTRDAEDCRLEMAYDAINHKRGWAKLYLWLDTIEIQKCFSLLWF